MENTSSAKLLAILKGNDYQSLELTTQGTKPVEISNHLFSEGLDGDETLTINDGDIKNIDNHNKANVHEQSRIDDDAEMKSDHELFEEIIKTPDQNEIDELLNDKSPSKTERKPKTDGMLSWLRKVSMILNYHIHVSLFTDMIRSFALQPFPWQKIVSSYNCKAYI